MNSAVQESEKIKNEEFKQRKQWETWDKLFESPAFKEYLYDRSLRNSSLPRNLDAEMSVIGACLMQDIKSLECAVEMLSPADFFYSETRIAFIAISKLNTHRILRPDFQIDIITVTSYLRIKQKMQKCSPAFLASCIDVCPNAANIIAYAEPVRECSKLRRIIELASLMQDANLLAEHEWQTDFIINKARRSLDEIENKHIKPGALKKLFTEEK